MTKKSLVDELSEYRDEDEKIIKSFYSKRTLSPAIFDKTNEMHEDVRARLLLITEKFVDFLGVNFFVYDVVLTGSLANYNWSEYSDVDLHVMIDYDESEHNNVLLKEFFDAKKNVWNNLHDIEIKNFEVEMYVQDVKESHISSGVYSVLNNEWLVEPQKEKKFVDERCILEKGEAYANLIDSLIKKHESGENVIEKVETIKKKLKRFRQSGLDRGGEYSYENLTFKLLRRNGYIKKLIDLKKEVVDNKLSVNEMFLDLTSNRVLENNWRPPNDSELHYFNNNLNDKNDDVVASWNVLSVDVSLLGDGTLIGLKGDIKIIYSDKINTFDNLSDAWKSLQGGLNNARKVKKKKL